MRQSLWFWALLVGVIGCGGPPAGGDDAAVGTDATAMDGSTGSDCTSDADCDDDQFCSGVERCSPGTSGADERGCVAGSAPCGAGQACSETADVCETECPDADGDGVPSGECGGTDCDDADERRYPSALEVCDRAGLDEDCDPTTLGHDADSDGYVSDECCNELPTGRIECGLDCDDTLAGVGPSQTDVCGAGDQDCDGAVDENPDQVFYRDLDGDGHGVVDMTTMACSAPPGYAVLAGDCNDALGAVNPGVGELCNLRDDDCNEGIDEGCGCTPDGLSEACGATDVGTCRLGSRTCVAGAWSECSGLVEPATEICEGAQDEDCDGTVDDGCECVNGETRLCGMSIGVCRSVLQACSGGRWPRACADEPGVVAPGLEDCDGLLDQDCDGAVDEDCACTNGAVDRSACGTDAGECVSGMRTCSAGAWGTCSGGVGPATETCDGSRDEDCDSAIDEGCGCTNGAMRPCGVGECVGAQTCVGGAWGACNGDAPAPETCNGLDDDCDGRSDASDSDTAMVGSSCGTDAGLCTLGTYACPGAALVCSGVAPTTEVCDHRDQDCDAMLDDGLGAATCTWTGASTSTTFDNEFACTSSCSEINNRPRLGTGVVTDQVPVAAVLRASEQVDWGRSMSVTARFDAQYGGTDSWALGRFGVIISPLMMPSGENFPITTGSTRGYAAVYDANPFANHLQIWELTSTGAFQRATGTAWPSTCIFNNTTAYEYRVTLSNDGGTISARLETTRPGCPVQTASYVDTDWQQLLYGDSELLAYPRYDVGAWGDNDGWLSMALKGFTVTRTQTSERPHCVACAW